MVIPEYTAVIGVDANHLCQLQLVWPTWLEHKPSLLKSPLIIFYDREQCNAREIHRVTQEHQRVILHCWPPKDVYYEGNLLTRFGDPQRYKMLAGFVHVPPILVSTPYWLKIDLDTVATGQDNWIDGSWFEGEPAIVSHPWGYTKPPTQMIELDDWTKNNELAVLNHFRPLNLIPESGSSVVRHKRIISWVGFFNTEFTRFCSTSAEKTCGIGKLPVPSQDGFMWYVARRCGYVVRRENMKSRGWVHCSSARSIQQTIKGAM